MKNCLKNLLFATIIILVSAGYLFSQDIQNVKKNPIFLGFNIGLGSSWQLSTSVVDAKIKPQFAIQFGARAIFNFSENIGVLTDLGAYIINTKIQTDMFSREYNLHYFYVSAAPCFFSRNIYVSVGLFFGFIGYAKYVENNIEDKSKDHYTIPDIGLNFTTGYMLRLSNLIHLFINLNVKYQLSYFRWDDMGLKSGKIFSILLDLSLLFEL